MQRCRCNRNVTSYLFFYSKCTFPSSVSRWYETGVPLGFFGFGFGFVWGPRSDEDIGGSDGSDSVEGLGGRSGGDSDEGSWVLVAAIYSLESIQDCSCSHPFWAVNLNFGSLFQHDAMTYCQFPHGCRVPSMWVGRRFCFTTSSRTWYSVLLSKAALNAVSPYHSSQSTYPKLYISALLL